MTIARASLLFAGYLLVTVALTHPMAWHLTQVPHDIGDPLLSTVLLWWNAHHLPLTARWWNGSFFYPATGVVSFSDHRLGEALIATPLQWIGVAPLVAANITLLALFPLCAVGAHWLGHTLTRRHDAAVVAGLAYGFSPYRFAHIEHMELLAAFGMPVALVALHRHLATPHRKWLLLFGAAMLLQALTSSYYFLFFLIMLALWIVWFVRRNELELMFGVAVASVLVVIAMMPIAKPYLAIHEHYGMTRPLSDIVTLSADVTSIFTASPLSALWGWTSTLNGPERQLFPGATILLLVAAATTLALRREAAGGRRNGPSLVLLAVGALFAGVAAFTAIHGPWQIAGISIGTPFKTLSFTFYLLVVAILASSAVREAFGRRSTFAFYVLAAAALFIFALGPKPAFLHQQILYQPPYAWLMRLGVFREGVRVPARFGMLVVLSLAAAGSLAFDRLFPAGNGWTPRLSTASPWRQRSGPSIAAVLVCVALLADSWTWSIPMLPAPARWPPAVSTSGIASVLELPLGETIHDVSAMYRSILTNLPTVNGYSGYFPAHYEPLRLALEERDETALSVLAADGPLLVVVERAWPYARERLLWLRSLARGADTRAATEQRDSFRRAAPMAAEITSNEEYAWFIVRGPARIDPVTCGGSLVPVSSARDWRGAIDLARLSDGDDNTFWSSGDAQRAGDALVLDLGAVVQPCSVRLTLGSHTGSYPRALTVATSVDGDDWNTTFEGKLGGTAVAAALTHPRNAAIELPVAGRAARYVRLQLVANQPDIAWLITELAVNASKQE